MRVMRNSLLILLIGVIALKAGAFSAPNDDSRWAVQTSGIRTNLRGISVAYASRKEWRPVLWASGSNGVVLRSLDLGKTWEQLSVAGAEKLDFRGIQVIDANTTYLMSSGAGDNSRIYKTTDAGKTWKQQYTDTRSGFFLDAIVCISETKCFALSDPIDGKFLVIATQDGEHWNEFPRDTMPAALSGEGAFAAGNSALTVYGDHEIYFGTGGGATSRVFHSADMGKKWTATATPFAAGIASAGIFSVARSGNTVVVVGGDYKQLDLASSAAAYSSDRGKTWRISAGKPGGYRSGVTALDAKTFMAVGPNGEDVSFDGGAHWTSAGSVNLNAVTALDAGNVWGAGVNGTVAQLRQLIRRP
jgi:photosystem II stability/assembly factor-like uncharacterized protein